MEYATTNRVETLWSTPPRTESRKLPGHKSINPEGQSCGHVCSAFDSLFSATPCRVLHASGLEAGGERQVREVELLLVMPAHQLQVRPASDAHTRVGQSVLADENRAAAG